jgi:hypothetical protein
MAKKLFIVPVLLAGLVACSTISEAFQDYPKEVAILQASLATAEHTALIYAALPVCGKTSAVACRTPDITKKIGAYDEAAYTAVAAARVAEDETSIQAAQTAIEALRSLTSTTPGAPAQ